MKRMFWIDLEMSGLDENTDKILEIAVIITDLNFEVLETYHKIVFQPPEVLETMNDWCKNTHGKSGLTALIPNGIPLAQVEKELIELSGRHFTNEKIVLCGNSVGTDKRFLEVGMPVFSQQLHYRIVDISSFKEIFSSIYGVEFQKKDSHRARDDILESIAELGHYLTFVNAKR